MKKQPLVYIILINWNGYKFDKEWELVTGKWTIQIYYKDQKLLEKTFAVYLP